MFLNPSVYEPSQMDLETPFVDTVNLLLYMMLGRHGEKHMRLSVEGLSRWLASPIYPSRFRCGSLKTMALVIPLMNLKRELPGATARW